MDALADAIDAAVKGGDYSGVAGVFSFGPSSWQSVGQGEQRSLAARFVSLAVSDEGFLPKAFGSGQAMQAMTEALGHLPTTVPGAADNVLRQKIFEYKVNEEGDYIGAARVLAGMRMDDDPGGVYYATAAEKCDVYVKIAECFLEESETVEADSAVSKAGTVVESIDDPENHTVLILRYKSTYARVLDSNRKFLQAASRYHDLSQSPTSIVKADDLLSFLGKAATCAILTPSGPQRSRVLGHICKDERLSELDGIPGFETHSTILTKMHRNQILGKEELEKFEKSLEDHQRAVMGDGLTLLERGVVEHNMIAVSKIYRSIYVKELAAVLGVPPGKAEKIAASMIVEGSLAGSIDQVDGLVEFDPDEDSAGAAWDRAISGFCVELNRVTDAITMKQQP